MQLNKHALVFFSLLCDSISTTLENLTLKARLTIEIAQTSPVEYITDEDWTTLVKHWSDPKYQVGYMYLISHILNLYLCMCLTCVSSSRLTV